MDCYVAYNFLFWIISYRASQLTLSNLNLLLSFDLIWFDVVQKLKKMIMYWSHDKVRSSETVSICENIKYKWNANFIDVYKTNITKYKNNIE